MYQECVWCVSSVSSGCQVGVKFVEYVSSVRHVFVNCKVCQVYVKCVSSEFEVCFKCVM